jgi:transcriptional regulator with XRE-family HTH domain
VSAKRCNERVSGLLVTADALLRQARQAAPVSPREVARPAGVQQSVVSAYEGGGREPSLATLASPVEACGVTLPVEGFGVTLKVHLGDELPSITQQHKGKKGASQYHQGGG